MMNSIININQFNNILKIFITKIICPLLVFLTTLLLITAILLITIVFLIGSDIVTDTYQTYDKVVEDKLFLRSWLPNFIPKSSKHITTSNNLDTNISSGEFYFDLSDFAQFKSNLSTFESISSPLANFESFIANNHSQGYEVYKYEDSYSTWVFACHVKKGHCEYRMWLK